MKILAILFGDRHAGSTQHRLFQYIDYLQANGIEFEFVRKHEINRKTVQRAREVDAVFNQKCLFNNFYAAAIIRNAKKTFFDFDDAVWTKPGGYKFLTALRVRRRLHPWLKNADVVLAANNYLGNYARRFRQRVEIFPMALDLREWFPGPENDQGKVRVGWAGSPATVKYLESIDPVLRRVENDFPEVEFMVYSGKKPTLSVNFSFQPFSPGTEADFIRKLDIGLLPLEADDFLKGKSPVKAIQYMACGVPVIGYVAGGTRELLTDDRAVAVDSPEQWYNAFKKLIRGKDSRQRLGMNGREHVLKNHNMELAQKKLLQMFIYKAHQCRQVSPSCR